MPASAQRRQAAVALAVATLLTPLIPASATAQTALTPADGIALFENNVLPVLERRCFSCHGDPDKAENGLVLANRRGLLQGGERGPAISTSEPHSSLLLHVISYEDEQLQMPPSGRLADADIEAIRQWVQLGAPFGGDEDEVAEVVVEDEYEITDADREWWSVRPLLRPEPPEVADGNWPLNGIDHFLLARLDAAGLEPPPTADRRALIRRATYDLTGLPPTLAEVEAFEQDERPDAWERLIDGLLASPHYGERWGRHWLDLVRYAETDGYERDRKKPSAWRYRDWVIDALNADMPYNEFLIHQLAGDEIDDPTAASIIATGYLRLGIWDDEPTDTELAQYDDLDSILDTTSRVMLGMSIGCARCHNHRGDPIPQTDYYRMLSFFRGIAPYKVGGGNQPTPENYRDLIPEDLGSAEAEAEAVRWRAERSRLVRTARAAAQDLVGDASAGELAAARAEADRGLLAHVGLDETMALVAADAQGRYHGRVEDGEDDAVRMPRPVGGDFTISLWFRTDSPAPGGVQFDWSNGSPLVNSTGATPASRGRGFGIAIVGDGYVVAGVGALEDGEPQRTNLTSDPGYNDGNWHQAAFTRQQNSGALALFVDGVLVAEGRGATISLDKALENAPFLDLGRRGDRGHFQGALDDVRFYDRVLSSREILDRSIDPAGGGAALALYVGHTGIAPDAGATPTSLRPEIGAYSQAVDALLTHPRYERSYLEVLRVKEIGPEAPPTHVLIRGNPHAPVERVEPGFPLILGNADPGLEMASADSPTTGRRLALARWLAGDGNLRTSRVMANRLWQYHFGRGLSPTPNDFGRFGQKATHPELIDWLATEFTARDWSLKSMHRLIMTSRAYQMSSRPPQGALEADPANDLFSRFNMRRLTAEEIRDSVLAATGRLNLELGGPSVYPPMPAEVLATASQPDAAWGETTPEQATRRSIYIHVKRSLLDPLLESLDFADTDSTCPVRFTTTQPTQALMMLNGEFMSEQAAELAERAFDAGGTLDERVAEALELVLARRPQAAEIARGVGLIEELERGEGFAPDAAFASFSLLLLNLNEFVYLD